MNEETKKLFDAPWTVYGEPDDCSYVIQNASEDEIATVFMTDEAKRITHLPELYDALIETAYEHCQLCIYQHSESASKMPFPHDMATNGGASFCFPNCPRLKRWKLLKKVRDGK